MLTEPHPRRGSFETDYLRRFDLSRRPFGLTPDPAFYFESESHREALAGLRAFLSQRESFALIFGDVGTGKTMLSRYFLTSLDRESFKAGLIINPVMEEMEFLTEACKRLGFSDMASSENPTEGFQRALVDASAGGKRQVLAIDEAQLLSDRVLRFLGDLLRFGAEERGPLHVILLGQDEMVARLLAKDMDEVRREVTVTYRLRPLREEEVARYVEHRLSMAGSTGSVGFTDDAVRLLYAGSAGYPRIINTLCDHCLVLLSSQPGTRVNRKIVRQAMAGRA